jgi:hypothetical protein
MEVYQIPIDQWSVQNVQEWLTDIGLGKLNEAIEHNAGWLFKTTRVYFCPNMN